MIQFARVIFSHPKKQSFSIYFVNQIVNLLMFRLIDLIGVDVVALRQFCGGRLFPQRLKGRFSLSALRQFFICLFSLWFAPSSTTERPILQLSHRSKSQGPFHDLDVVQKAFCHWRFPPYALGIENLVSHFSNI
ncbi:MAG TPA: hypothetical protein VME69_13615 [Methylocella sp.]|nr:hypothetical protein [Methylocella sp.]